MSAPDEATVGAAISAVAEAQRQRIVINRVAQRVMPPLALMNTGLRQQLAAAEVDLTVFSETVTARLMTPAELQAQIATAWAEAEA